MKRRLLIIDDDPHVAESLKYRLESMGYDVVEAGDGRRGLAFLALARKQDPIEGVVLDLHMPFMDGIEVLREIRARHPDVPVLMMTAGPDRRVLEEAVRMGASGYLIKPFEPDRLKELCQRVFPLKDGHE